MSYELCYNNDLFDGSLGTKTKPSFCVFLTFRSEVEMFLNLQYHCVFYYFPNIANNVHGFMSSHFGKSFSNSLVLWISLKIM